mgnify:CR=1 FL=1
MKYLKVNDLCQKLIDLHKKYKLTDLEVGNKKIGGQLITCLQLSLKNNQHNPSPLLPTFLLILFDHQTLS